MHPLLSLVQNLLLEALSDAGLLGAKVGRVVERRVVTHVSELEHVRPDDEWVCAAGRAHAG